MSLDRNAQHRVESLRAGGVRSARAISEALIREGHRSCSESQVKRYLRGLRGEPALPVSRPWPAPTPASTPSLPSTPSQRGPETDTYVPDHQAIGEHAVAIGELIDRRVDAAIDAELEDPVALADRWRNRAEAAGWPNCAACGQPTRPEENDQ